MSAYQDKYHIAINDVGYIISPKRGGEKWYQKKLAPSFVNKFGSGDVSYRDSTFWQFWAIANWRNGSKQLRLDDQGKFWKSENVNVTVLDEITLSRSLTLVGQTAAGTKVNALAGWRNTQSWWNTNYGYRKQITVTAATAAQIPAGYPIKITEDTAALQTASKLRSDRNDWRVVYNNGSTLVELKRDYVATTATFVGAQAAIPAGTSDSNYFIYYGYASESTNNQPTTEAHWNEVYGMFGTTPDANTKGVFHYREGTGTSIADDSAQGNTGTAVGTPTWGTDGMLGRYLAFNGSSQYVSFGGGTDTELGSMTLEAWIYPTTLSGTRRILSKWNNKGSPSGGSYNFSQIDGKLRFGVMEPPGGEWYATTTVSPLAANVWQHVAVTYDGSANAKFYVNGAEMPHTNAGTGAVPTGSGVALEMGRNQNDNNEYFAGRFQHARISNAARTSFPYALSAGNQPTATAGGETTTQPAQASTDLYAGCSDGKLYKYDGTTITETFDARALTWYEDTSFADTEKFIGDVSGTETAQAMSFQVPGAVKVKSLRVRLKKLTGTPGDITVRIETNSTDKPSGTLADAAATTTIAAFSETSYGWLTATFASSFSLAATTTFWIVLKTAAAANDTNYSWHTDASSPTYTNGNMAVSTDGGSTWTAVAGTDALFTLYGDTTQINDLLVSSVGGTRKLLIATGDPASQSNGDARLYTYDGTNYTLEKVFSTATESQVMCLAEFNSKLYAGIGPQAKVYEGTAPATWTISKDIDVPNKPGYVYALKEYNNRLYAGGGAPEFLADRHYGGFWYVYDTTTWTSLYPFDFTEIRAFEFYDSFLFGTTYDGRMYVYDSATLNPLFNFTDGYNYRVSLHSAQLYDDKIYFLLYPQDGSNETNVGIWVFDRHGISLAHTKTGVTGYRCSDVVNNILYIGTGDDGNIYKLDSAAYAATGYVQTSYFDANLPSVTKLFHSVTVNHDPLVAGQSVVIYYKFKESDSWTTLGTSDTVDATTDTLSFAAGTTSKKITLKIELNSSNSATTPRVTEVITQYKINPTRKWLWTMRLLAKKNCILLDKTTDSRTAEQIRTALETAQNSNALITFTDVDGTEYSALFDSIDESSWVVNQSDTNEDEILVSILEA